MTIYFTSDEHYFHKNIIKYCDRKYQSVEEMNKDLIDRHNAIVKEDDVVYHLGDFSLKDPKEILNHLNGKKILVAGNHDRCYHSHNKYRREVAKYLEYGFAEVHQEIVDFYGFTLNHLPFSEDHSEPIRFSQFRPIDNDQWLLHGHVHTMWKINKKQINVGVDVNDFQPISFDHIISLTK